MSQYQNSPTGVLDDNKGSVDVARHWHDLSKTVYTSIPFGMAVPTFCRLLLGNTRFKLNTHTAIQTNAAVSPNLSGINFKNAFFFAPLRLYAEGLFLNNFGEFDAVGDIPFPRFGTAITPDTAVLRGSLLERLGYPPMTDVGVVLSPELDYFDESYVVTDMESYYSNYNALRPIAYYGIIMHYFVDAYEKRLPFVHSSHFFESNYADTISVTHSDTLYDVGVDEMNNLLKSFRISPRAQLGMQTLFDGDSATNLPSLISDVTGEYSMIGVGTGEADIAEARRRYAVLSSLTSLEGLCPVTHLPDLYNVWYDTDEVNKLVIQTQGTIQSIRLASADFALGSTLLVRGKRYTDYNNVISGASLNLSDYPIFVGSDEFDISFQDSVSTVSTDRAPQGTPVSRGFGHSFDTNEMNFETKEPGILMCITTAIPRVAYANSVDLELSYTGFDEIPNRFYDGVGFQSLRFGDMMFTNSHLDDQEVGSQAFFMQQMTTADVVSGLLATPAYKSYSFVRQFGLRNELLNPEDSNPAQVVEVTGSKYVLPRAYDYIFPAYAPITVLGESNMPYQDNLFAKIRFDLRALQPLTNQVINTSM